MCYTQFLQCGSFNIKQMITFVTSMLFIMMAKVAAHSYKMMYVSSEVMFLQHLGWLICIKMAIVLHKNVMKNYNKYL